jgi:luciferase family oxidoreductase group 1
MIPFSVLDLSPVPEGTDVAGALANTVDLATHAERLGFNRYWLAEHHNMPGIASAATAVVIGRVAAATQRIRVGSGGIMLPNHSPLVVAEQFGTLEALFPGRIDLGLGRAPGTDQTTAHALRRDLATSSERFPDDVMELIALMEPEQPGQRIRAIPGTGSRVPVWILGSSLFGAQLAGALGLPFAFASHFAPTHLMDALAIYRDRFRPSERWPKPHAMVAVNVVAAETDEEARLLFTSHRQAILNLRSGQPGRLPRPDPTFDDRIGPAERRMLDGVTSFSAVGDAGTVRAALDRVIEVTRPDELIVAGQIHDHRARVRSFEIVAAVRDAMAA